MVILLRNQGVTLNWNWVVNITGICIKVSKHEIAIPLYENFVKQLGKELGKKVQTGIFGADMKVGLLNDGSFTNIIDSKKRE